MDKLSTRNLMFLFDAVASYSISPCPDPELAERMGDEIASVIEEELTRRGYTLQHIDQYACADYTKH